MVHVAFVALAMRLGVEVMGAIVIAVVGGAAFTIGAIVWWARVVEPWLFAPRAPGPAARPPVAVDDGRHLAFARALAAVAARYLDECEAESDR
jgi:hypothetical protein